MFWFGKNTERKPDDYRSEVHDSDGLLAHMDNGEVLWRPLDNPSVMRHQIFYAPNIRGFGLMQRERSFAAYQDMFQPLSSGAECLGRAAWQLGRRRSASGGIEHRIMRAWTTSSRSGIPKINPRRCSRIRFGYTLYWTRETGR